MKKMNLLISMISLIAANSAFAGHGVEKVLPNDAKNVQIASVTLDQTLTSQTETGFSSEGPSYQDNYSPSLSVKVTFNSKDSSFDETGLSDNGEGEVVVGGPALTFSIILTDAEAAAVKARTVDPKSLIAFSVTSETVQIVKDVYTDSCVYGTDSGSPDNAAECIQHVTTSEVRPVLDIDHK